MIRTLSQELKERGLIYQFSTDDLSEILDSKKRTAYLGVDPTADSIHIGNLVTYVLAQHLKNAGHKLILLVGGATGLIGDPSGKSGERDFASEKIIKQRAANISDQISNIYGLDKMEMVNNYDWFKDIGSLEFLREVGKHFNINTMLKRESVSKRIESGNGLSYTEFSYSLLQSYDFYHLFKTEKCDLQIGGSDQWGNIVSGIDYIRKKAGKEVFGVTLPLIVDQATGEKFGKSAGNAIWLNPEKTSIFAFYQFWLNVDDESVVDLLKKFTMLDLDEIKNIEEAHKKEPHKREAQKILAYEVTKFVHGPKVVDAVVKASNIIFRGDSLEGLTKETEKIILEEAPTYKAKKKATLIDVLLASKLCSSKREAKELLAAGSIKLDDTKVTDPLSTLADFNPKKLAILKKGKRSVCILQIQ